MLESRLILRYVRTRCANLEAGTGRWASATSVIVEEKGEALVAANTRAVTKRMMRKLRDTMFSGSEKTGVMSLGCFQGCA